MLIYFDNCCLNRPFDDMSQIKISLEAQAKLYVQSLVRDDKIDMVSSFVLEFENLESPHFDRSNDISNFLKLAKKNIGTGRVNEVRMIASKIMQSGVHFKDACHVACAELAGCDYLLSTDRRLLKYKSGKVILTNPIDFLEALNGGEK